MESISILGCGWLGKSVGAALVKSGYRVSGSTTQEARLKEIQSVGIKPVLLKFDPRLSDSDGHTFFQADILIVSIPPKRKFGLTDVFLEQMKQVIQEVLKGKVSIVLFISSTSVYADTNGVVTEEDADANSYLVKAENLFFAETKFSTTVLRFGGLVGAGRHPGRFLAGKKDIQGGNHAVNVVHQKDCIEIIKAILKQEAWGEVFNACADQHPARKEFYSRASAVLKLESPQFSNEDVSENKIVNCDKLKIRLNYDFIYPDPMRMLESM